MDKNKKKHAEEGGSLEQRVHELEEKVERLERNATAAARIIAVICFLVI